MMFDKVYRTTRTPYGGGMAIKTMDCKDAERIIIDALEGRMEGITEVVYGSYDRVTGYRKAFNDDGYMFELVHDRYFAELDSWKYVMLEKWENILFIHVSDIDE